MKRFLIALSAVLFFASCDNAGTGNVEEQIKDSLDSIKNLKVESVQDAANEAIDTIEKNHDSLKNRIDSVAGQTRDSANSIRK